MTLFDQYLQRATVENVSSTSEKLYRGIFEEDIADYIAIYCIFAFTNEWNVAKLEIWLMNDLFY